MKRVLLGGGNYSYIVEWINTQLKITKKIITLALYENIGSKFKSDFVGEYYNDKIEDLTFWWERYNRHWK